jgi:hypothetical protein
VGVGERADQHADMTAEQIVERRRRALVRHMRKLHAGAAAAEVPATGVVPSVCVFDVNGSLLDTDALAPYFPARRDQRNFGDQLLDEQVAKRIEFFATKTKAPGPPITLSR